MLRNRRGVTLIELLVTLVVLGFVGMATTKIMRTMLSATAAQVAVATNQGNVRNAQLAIPLEFREIGYDTVPLSGAARSDIKAMAANRITFNAMRGVAFTCGTPTLTSFQMLKSYVGLRRPIASDSFLLFVENDPNFGSDDQWVPILVQSITETTCGADSSWTLTLSAGPIVDPAAATAMAISNYFVGGPIRWYERMEYGPYTDPVTNDVYLGARSINQGQASLLPMVGPIADTMAFQLTYYNGAGTTLNPASANPQLVRALGIQLTGLPPSPVSLAGTARRSRAPTTITTRVALRNTLRP